MADFLALHRDDGYLCGLDAHVQRGHARVRAGVILDWPEGMSILKDPAGAGEWLKQQFQQAGVSSRQAVVTLSRDDCIGRRLDVPDVPDDELPDLVRMQAATVCTVPLERLLWDFLPLPREAGAQGRSVMLYTVMRDRIEAMRKALEVAGLELVSVGIAPAAVAELTAQAERRRGDDPHQIVLAFARYRQRIEICALRDDHLLLSHSIDIADGDGEDEARLLQAELSRSLVTLQQRFGDAKPARGWIIGGSDEDSRLQPLLARRLDCPVELLDLQQASDLTFSAPPPASPALFAAPAGALLQAAGGTVPAINFLDPRRPPVKQDRSKYRMAAAAAAVLLLVGGGYAMLHMERADLDRQIGNLEQQELDLNRNIKAGEPVLAAANSIEEWTGQQVDWLEQIQEIHKLLPGTGDVYLTDFRVSPATRDSLASIRATGYARERQQVEALYARLAAARYRVRPQEITSDKKDAKYPWKFEVDMDLVAQPQPAAKSPASPAPAANLTAKAR